MSEYWVSGSRIWCKYCRIFVYDNKPSRQKHDTSQKHLANIKKHRVGIDKKTTQKLNEDLETKRELERIERIARSQYVAETGKLDVNVSTVVKSTSTRTEKATAAPPPPPSAPIAPPGQDIQITGTTKIGAWEVVEEPKINIVRHKASKEDEDEDEDVQGDPEDLNNFKIQEKVQPAAEEENEGEEGGGDISFKKRKRAGGAGRNTRKKTE